MKPKTPRWMEWIRTLQAVSQTGLHYSANVFDRERYQALGQLAAEILTHHSSLSLEEALELQTREMGYATPKVDVRGVVFREGRILLVSEAVDEGRWTVPGGWADVNEPPSRAVEREVWEESGYEVKAEKLLAVYDRDLWGHQPPFPFSVYKLFFLCRIVGQRPVESPEILDVGFFEPGALPELSPSRVSAGQIRRFFEQIAHPEWPTEFD